MLGLLLGLSLPPLVCLSSGQCCKVWVLAFLAAYGRPTTTTQCKSICQRFGMKLLAHYWPDDFHNVRYPQECCEKCDKAHLSAKHPAVMDPDMCGCSYLMLRISTSGSKHSKIIASGRRGSLTGVLSRVQCALVSCCTHGGQVGIYSQSRKCDQRRLTCFWPV